MTAPIDPTKYDLWTVPRPSFPVAVEAAGSPERLYRGGSRLSGPCAEGTAHVHEIFGQAAQPGSVQLPDNVSRKRSYGDHLSVLSSALRHDGEDAQRTVPHVGKGFGEIGNV